MPTCDLEDVTETRIMKGLHEKEAQYATAHRAERVIDPVCGIDVHEITADCEVELLGGKYAFCSPGCKTVFEKDPEKYTRLLRFARNDW